MLIRGSLVAIERGANPVLLAAAAFASLISLTHAARSEVDFPFVKNETAGVLLRGIVTDRTVFDEIYSFSDWINDGLSVSPNPRFPMMMLSIGPDAIVDGRVHPDYVEIYPSNTPVVLRSIELEIDECNIETIIGSNGETLLWVAVDSDQTPKIHGVPFAAHCFNVAVGVSLGLDFFDILDLSPSQMRSVILQEVN